jgi:predicted nucleic acid-binding protein
MSIRSFLMNSMAFRNMMLISGYENNYSLKKGEFTPYFNYVIGPYQREGFLLNFPKEPYAEQYYNAIFIKLYAYNAADAVKYIQAHYDLYLDKPDFLKFLQLELRHRVSWLGRKAQESKVIKWLSIMNLSLEWVEEKLAEISDSHKQLTYNQFIRNDLTVLVKNELQGSGSSNEFDDVQLNKLAIRVSDKVQPIVETVMNQIDARLASQQQTGSIILSNIHQKDKLISLFHALKELQKEAKSKATEKHHQGEPLFTKMDNIDIAHLMMNFVPFNQSKIDAAEQQYYRVRSKIDRDDPAYQQLNKALQKYFFT